MNFKNNLLHVPFLFAGAASIIAPATAQSLRVANYPFGLKQATTETAAVIDAYLIAEYNDWKAHYVTTSGTGGNGELRIQRDAGTGYDTTSSGQGYGMLLSVYFGDQTTFNGLYRYAQAHLDPATQLMHRQIRNDNVNLSEFRLPIPHAPAMIYVSDLLLPEGQQRYLPGDDPYVIANPSEFLPASTGSRSFDSVTDADMDIAAALCFAHSKWGSSQAVNYLVGAAKYIKHIMDSDVTDVNILGMDHKFLKAGSQLGSRSYWNPSHFTPAWLKIFSKFLCDNETKIAGSIGDPVQYATDINDLILTMYSELTSIHYATNGLFPDWCGTEEGVPVKASGSDRIYYPAVFPDGPIEMGDDGNYRPHQNFQSFNFFYEAVRIPWRIGLDYSLNGDITGYYAIVDYLGSSCFFNQATTLKDGFGITGGSWNWEDRDGSSIYAGGDHHTAAFVSMAATSAMGVGGSGQVVTTNASNYYNETKRLKTAYTETSHFSGNSLRLLSLLYLSGRMADLTKSVQPALSAQFMTHTPDLSRYTISANIRIKNTGSTDADISKISAKYWYTSENPAVPDRARLDFAFLLNGGYWEPSRSLDLQSTNQGGQNRVEILTFPKATNRILKVGNTFECRTQIGKNGTSSIPYNQANDYSFTPSTKFVDTSKITLYYDGVLVGGVEP